MPENGPDDNHYKALSWPYFVRRNSNQVDPSTEIWNLETLTYQKLPENYNFHLSKTNGDLFLAVIGGSLYAWNSTDGKYLGQRKTMNEGYEVAISPDGTRVVSIDPDTDTITILDFSELVKQIQKADKPADIYPVISYSPNTGITAGNTQSIISLVEDTPSATSLFKPTTPISAANATQLSKAGHFSPGAVNSLRWEADGPGVVIAGSRSLATLDTHGVFTQLVERNASFTSTATRSDGHLLASGVLEGWAFIYDVTLDKILISFEGGEEPALSPQGRYLVYTTQEEKLVTYDLEEGQALASLREMQPWVYHTNGHPIFSPDGSLVACVQDSNFVRVWIYNQRNYLQCTRRTGYGNHGAILQSRWSFPGRSRVPVPPGSGK